MNLKTRLPLNLAGLAAIPLIALNIVLYMVSSNAILGSAQDYLDAIAAIEVNQVQKLLQLEQEPLRHFANSEIARQRLVDNGEQVTQNFELALQDFKRGRDLGRQCFLLNGQGMVIDSDSGHYIGMDFSTYRFFQSLTLERKTVSNVFRFLIDADPVVAIAGETLSPNGKTKGYMVEFLPIRELSYLTKSINIGNTGYGYIMDDKGTIVTHPDYRRVGANTENAFMLRQIRLDSLDPKRLASTQNEVQSYEYRGELKYMGFRRLPELGWYLVITQTVTEIQTPVSSILAISVATLLLMVGASLFVAIRLSHFITRPIDLIHATVEELGKGNLETKCDYKADNELGDLSRHINQMIGQIRDSLSTIREQDAALLSSDIRYRLAVDGSNDAVYEWQTGSGLLYVSSKYEELVGLPEGNLQTVQSEFLNAVEASDLELLKQSVRNHINNHDPYFRVEIRVRDRAGDTRWLLIRGKAHRDDQGRALRLAGSITNITDRRVKEERIHSLAYTDQLTGLPNRQSYIEDATQYFSVFAHEGKQSGVALLDIDDFRKINDALGHSFGDQILIQIARRLETAADKGQVYRFGGDEFIVVFPPMADMGCLDAYTQKIMDCLKSGIQILGKHFYLTMTIGVCLFPQDAHEPLEILRKADTAMYAAKIKGKGTLAFYNQEMYDGLSQRIHLETVLRQAIREDWLVLYYQPLVSMADYSLTGFEALMRMPDPQGGFISPDKFIPIAEESGLIHQMGYWIFAQVCHQIQEWDRQSHRFEYVSLNVSALQFHDPHFAERLYAIVREYGIEPQRIQIEITETALMESWDTVMVALEQIRSWGFLIALDDFGTGYSSLGYLKTIPITSLKMDKTFVHDIADHAKHEAIADGIIQMATAMGLQVIAEGIETGEQFRMLAGKGCTVAQGFLFSLPKPASELESIFSGEFAAKLS